MTPLIILGALAVIPLLAIVLLRVNGAIAFMSLCLGSVLVTYTSSDVTGVLTSMSTSNSILATTQYTQLGLLIIPLLLTILFTRRSVKGAKGIINTLPALATGLLFVILVVPLLNASLQHQVHAQGAWHQLSNAQTGVILAGALFSIVFLLFTHRRKKGGGEEEGKKKGKKKE